MIEIPGTAHVAVATNAVANNVKVISYQDC